MKSKLSRRTIYCQESTCDIGDVRISKHGQGVGYLFFLQSPHAQDEFVVLHSRDKYERLNKLWVIRMTPSRELFQ